MKTFFKKILVYGFIFYVMVERSKGNAPESGLNQFLDVSEDALRSLYLQQCTILPLLEHLCAVFLETQSGIGSKFVGVCSCNEMRNWTWCAPETKNSHKEDCTFLKEEDVKIGKFHRMLCDFSIIPRVNSPCNCSLSNTELVNMEGFPTCGLKKSETFCNLLKICDNCPSGVVESNLHSLCCNNSCNVSSRADHLRPKESNISSKWTEWSTGICSSSCGSGVFISESKCETNQSSGSAADCLDVYSRCKKEERCEFLRDTQQDGGWKMMKKGGYCENTSSCITPHIQDRIKKFQTLRSRVSTFTTSSSKNSSSLDLERYKRSNDLSKQNEISEALRKNMEEDIYEYKDLEFYMDPIHKRQHNRTKTVHTLADPYYFYEELDTRYNSSLMFPKPKVQVDEIYKDSPNFSKGEVRDYVDIDKYGRSSKFISNHFLLLSVIILLKSLV